MIESIKTLTAASSGWCFSATSISGKKLTSFHVEELAASMEANSPDLCHLISSLLSLAPQTVTPDMLDGLDAGAEADDELWVVVDGDLRRKAIEGGYKKSVMDNYNLHCMHTAPLYIVFQCSPHSIVSENGLDYQYYDAKF